MIPRVHTHPPADSACTAEPGQLTVHRVSCVAGCGRWWFHEERRGAPRKLCGDAACLAKRHNARRELGRRRRKGLEPCAACGELGRRLDPQIPGSNVWWCAPCRAAVIPEVATPHHRAEGARHAA
jgi:hypothetical protein